MRCVLFLRKGLLHEGIPWLNRVRLERRFWGPRNDSTDPEAMSLHSTGIRRQRLCRQSRAPNLGREREELVWPHVGKDFTFPRWQASDDLR